MYFISLPTEQLCNLIYTRFHLPFEGATDAFSTRRFVSLHPLEVKFKLEALETDV